MHKKYQKRHISIGACIGFALFLAVFAIYLVSKFSVPFANFINDSISTPYRFAMAKFADIIPFSLFEFALITIPLQLIVIGWLAVRRFKSGEGRVRFVLNILSAALLLLGGHLLALGVAYNTTPIAQKMNIPLVEVTEDRLAEAMISLRDEANALSAELALNEDGTTASGYTLDEMSALICKSYSDFSAEYGFPASFESRAKGITFSNIMSYFSLGGIYTFYTGEANVNMLYPDYDIAFTAAHELSHQRGILREDEANFMAYLVLSRSEDPYLRYSAALSMYSYIGSSLYRTNEEKYFEISQGLFDIPRADLVASSAVSKKYGNTIFSDISRTVNDLFLKSNGTEGVVSYGMVTKLALAYFEAKK